MYRLHRLAISGFLGGAIVGQALAADGVVNPLEQINHARVLGLRTATPLGQCVVGNELCGRLDITAARERLQEYVGKVSLAQANFLAPTAPEKIRDLAVVLETERDQVARARLKAERDTEKLENFKSTASLIIASGGGAPGGNWGGVGAQALVDLTRRYETAKIRHSLKATDERYEKGVTQVVQPDLSDLSSIKGTPSGVPFF